MAASFLLRLGHVQTGFAGWARDPYVKGSAGCLGTEVLPALMPESTPTWICGSNRRVSHLV